MPARSTAWPVVKSMMAAINEATADDVKVHRFFPGEQRVSSKMVWVDTITPAGGDKVPVAAGANRLHRDEKFVVRILARVLGKGSEDDTVEALWGILADIDDKVADNSLCDEIAGVLSVLPYEQFEFTCGRYPEGFIGDGVIELEVHSRLT